MTANVSAAGSRSIASQIRAQQDRIAAMQAAASGSTSRSARTGSASASVMDLVRADVAKVARLDARTARLASASSTLVDIRSTLETMRSRLYAARTDRGVDAAPQIAQLRSQLMSEGTRLSLYGVSIDFDAVSASSPRTRTADLVDGVDLSLSTIELTGSTTTTTTTMADAPGLAGVSTNSAGSASAASSSAGLSGTGAAIAGLAATVPSTLGLSGSSTDVAGNSTPAGTAKTAIGTFSTVGLQTSDRLVLGVAVSGSTRNVVVSLSGVSDAASLAASIQTSLTAAFGTAVAATSDASGRIYLETLATGSTASVSLNSVSGLDGNGTSTSTLGLLPAAAKASTTISGASQAIGTYNAAGRDANDRIQLQIAYAVGSSTLTTVDVTVSLAGVSDAATFAAALQSAINGVAGSGRITVVNASGALSLQTAGSLGQNQIWLKAVSGLDGNGTTTATAGLAAAAATGTDLVATTARTTTGSDFSGSMTVDANDEVAFDLNLDGATTRVRFGKAAVEAALASETGRAAGTGIVASAAQLAKVVARAVSESGVSGVNVAASGQRLVLSKTTAGVGSISVSGIAATSIPTTATYTAGTDFAGPTTLKDDATIRFDLAVDGTTKSLTISKATVETALASDSSYISGSGTISTATQLAAVVRTAMSQGSVSGATATASGNRVVFSKTAAGAGSVSVANVVSTASTAKAASSLTGTDFSPTTIGANDTLRFTLLVDGAVTDVTVDRAKVDTALSGRSGYVAGSGAIADVGSMVAVVAAGLASADLNGIAVAAEGQRLRFTKTAPGTGSVSVWNGKISTTTTSSTGSAQSLASIDLAPAASMTDADRTASIDSWIATIEGAIAGVEKSRAQIAFQNTRAETQKKLNARVAKILSDRAYASIDRDMTDARAKIASIEVRQALLRQTMSIVNARGSYAA